MTEASVVRRGDSPLARLLAVGIFALVLFQLYQSSKVGVTPRGTPAREALQHLHISVGFVLLLLVLPRLWLWWKEPRPARPARMPLSADALARHCVLAFYLTVLALCLTGPVFAWSEGHDVSLFGLFTLRDLIDKSYRVQVTLGYLHSVLGFFIFILAGFTLLVVLWQAVRYRVGPWRVLPGFSWS